MGGKQVQTTDTWGGKSVSHFHVIKKIRQEGGGSPRGAGLPSGARLRAASGARPSAPEGVQSPAQRQAEEE